MKLASIAAVALLTVAQGALADDVVPTYNVTGVWNTAGGEALQIFQKDDKLTMVFVGPDFAHKYSATYSDPTTVTGTQVRVTRATGCTTKMTMKYTVESSNAISVWAKAKDGNCDLVKGQVFTDYLYRVW